VLFIVKGRHFGGCPSTKCFLSRSLERWQSTLWFHQRDPNTDAYFFVLCLEFYVSVLPWQSIVVMHPVTVFFYHSHPIPCRFLVNGVFLECMRFVTIHLDETNLYSSSPCTEFKFQPLVINDKLRYQPLDIYPAPLHRR